MKKEITVTFKVEESELDRPLRVWLYQFLNRIGYEHEVVAVSYNGKRKTFSQQTELKNLKLREQGDL